MVQAYVLIKIEPNQLVNVINRLQRIKSIRHFDVVTGPYDIIANVEVPHNTALGELISQKIPKIRGIKETITCHILTLEV